MAIKVHKNCGGDIDIARNVQTEGLVLWVCNICGESWGSKDSFRDEQVKVEDEVSQLAYISMNNPIDSRQRKP